MSRIKFLSILKSVLWQQPLPDVSGYTESDWNDIVETAKTQAVLGILTEALTEYDRKKLVPVNLYLNAVLSSGKNEKSNAMLDVYSSNIQRILAENKIFSVLLKGQGYAINYPNPHHRQSGDIDIFVGFSRDMFLKACEVIKEKVPNATLTERNDRKNHAVFALSNGIVLEIHGNIKTILTRECDTQLKQWAQVRLKHTQWRSLNGNAVIVPETNFDALFVLIHFANHFMQGGVGLKQICDWMMILHHNRKELNIESLRFDIEKLNLWAYWEVFAAFAVEHLGMPAEEMPFYEKGHEAKARLVKETIFLTGNFGHHQKQGMMEEGSNIIIKKLKTIILLFPVYCKMFRIFPRHSLYSIGKYASLALDLTSATRFTKQ